MQLSELDVNANIVLINPIDRLLTIDGKRKFNRNEQQQQQSVGAGDPMHWSSTRVSELNKRADGLPINRDAIKAFDCTVD